MTIYSRWKPAAGGYEYFRSEERAVGLGDDLPVPSLATVAGIGAPSTDIGRGASARLTKVGAGAIAKGRILPLGGSGGVLGSVSLPSMQTTPLETLALALAAAAATAWAWARFGKKGARR